MAKKKPAKSKKLATGRTAVRKTAGKPVRQNPRKGARVVAAKKKRPAVATKEPVAKEPSAKVPVVKAPIVKAPTDKPAASKPLVVKTPVPQAAVNKPVVGQPVIAKAPGEVTASLARSKITGDEDLEQFFKEDQHAKQICRFLNVQTLKDLERYSANEILRRLSNPIKETVERIRRSLAQHQRCLAGDESYVVRQHEIAAKQAKPS
jgi:hypothetical protein